MTNSLLTAGWTELSAFEKAGNVALYLTIGIILLVFIARILINKFGADYQKPFTYVSTGVICGYAIGILAILFTLKLSEYYAEGYIEQKSFYPVVAIIGVAFILAIIGTVLSIFKKDKLKPFFIVSAIIVAIATLIVLILNSEGLYKQGVSDVTGEVLLYVFTFIIIAAITIISLLLGKKTEQEHHTKSIVYAAICIALSFALSYIRFFELPQGGSVTFASLVPLMLYSYMFGIRKGVLAGIIYGFLQFIQAPWFYHPVQFLLDYPIAFGAIGLSGLFKERELFKGKAMLQFALGATVAVIFRYFSHIISGIFVFGSADPNYGKVAWSFLYNAFTLVDLAIALVAGCLLLLSKAFRKQLESVKK